MQRPSHFITHWYNQMLSNWEQSWQYQYTWIKKNMQRIIAYSVETVLLILTFFFCTSHINDNHFYMRLTTKSTSPKHRRLRTLEQSKETSENKTHYKGFAGKRYTSVECDWKLCCVFSMDTTHCEISDRSHRERKQLQKYNLKIRWSRYFCVFVFTFKF